MHVIPENSNVRFTKHQMQFHSVAIHGSFSFIMRALCSLAMIHAEMNRFISFPAFYIVYITEANKFKEFFE